jgi:DNA mismatch repair protein MutS
MKNDGLTPMMRQYLKFKAQYPDKIVFFRMGDFYEMFGDDAVEAAPILGIALTSRSVDKDNATPLAGIPHHALEKYLPRLIEAGKKVVICEQIEDPKKAKGIVKRDVVEIVTPGTSTLEGALSPTHDAYLTAICGNRKRMGMAQLELSTGDFSVSEGEADDIFDQVSLMQPKEILYPSEDKESVLPPHALENGDTPNLTPLESIYFDHRLAHERLCRFFSVTTLDGFGVGDMKMGIAAAGAIFRYLEDNRQERLAHITGIHAGYARKRMILDAATVRNLELFTNLATGDEKHSFLWAINRTGSAAGARRLRRSVAAPFVEIEKINSRLDAVAELTEKSDISAELAGLFKKTPDLERLCGWLGMGKATPRALQAIRDTIGIGAKIKKLLSDATAPILVSIHQSMPDLSETADEIIHAIRDDAPPGITAGGIFRSEYSAELDDLNLSIKDARAYIAGLAAQEKKRTGIPSLKVGFNKVFGYYIEVTRTHADRVPADYIRKQTLVNAERYITEEMKAKEGLILEAEEKINRLEEELFRRLADRIAERLPDLMSLADLLAETDLVNGFAQLARQERYVHPKVSDDRNLSIIQGRHPVLAQLLGHNEFVANDAVLDADDTSVIILTGPNMSGKSTWLRQVGLLVILAQMGSFVPADSAEIGIVERVFTRVGATDSLTRGQSTFLVEMVETANILHNKSEKSLILLDEIGRGTSTFDGLSVAWSVAESIYQHPTGTPRTLFATHYHEMTGLAGIYPRIKNFQVTVKKWGKDVIFLHQVVPGGCDDSYGIEVARLAGLPHETISRARHILRLLESGEFAKSELAKGVHVRLNQTSLFDAPAATGPSKLEEEIQNLDVDNMTPLQALEILTKLKDDVEPD